MENKNNVCMHLTNYAINKDAAGYDEGDGEETGHKRSLGAILKILKKDGADTDVFMDQVKDLVVKTVITGQPILAYEYRVGQPQCLDNSMAF